MIAEIHAIQRRGRVDGDLTRPVLAGHRLKVPKGLTEPKWRTTLPVEGNLGAR